MKLSSKLIALFSAALGITVPACDDMPDMYGTPNADYEIKGLVTNEENQPLENITVLIGTPTSTGDFSAIPYLPVVNTGKDGKFKTKFSYEPLTEVMVRFEDAEGIYHPAEAVEKCKFVKDKKQSFYDGKATIEVNVKLTKRLNQE